MSESASPESFRVTIDGPGVKIEREVDSAGASVLMSFLVGGGRLPTATTTAALLGHQGEAAGDPGAQDVGNQTIGEFLVESNAASHSHKILAFGVYFTRTGRKDFTRQQIEESFQDARESKPGNFSRDFSGVVAKKWMAPTAGSKDSFWVTNTGMKEFEALSRGEKPSRTRTVSKRPAKKTAAKKK